MNQYEKQDALHAIDGYWVPSPGIGNDVVKLREALAAAKQQFINEMRKRIENVESISLDQFKAYKGDCWPKNDPAIDKFFNDRHDARVATGNQSLFSD